MAAFGTVGVAYRANNPFDFTFISGHAPQADDPRYKRFWQYVTQLVLKLPNRSTLILMVDGND